MRGEGPSPLSFENFKLDLGRGCLRSQDGAELVLRPKSFDVLRYMLENAGRLVSRDELMAAVWPEVVVTDDSITQCIMEIRRVLGACGPRVLRTMPRRGYLLEAEVTRGDAAAVVVRNGEGDTPDIGLKHITGTAGPALPDLPSLVVLPFDNLSGSPEQDYFADGMTEELTTALSRSRWFFVIARNSAFTYKGRAVDVRQVGRELDVRYVLEGSVRKAGERVRISVQLIETRTAHHIWADRFEGTLGDIFELQDRVTEAVAAVIEPSLYSAEIERSASKPTDSLDAYDLYLRALPLNYALTKASNDTALQLINQAIALDPRFALAKAFAAYVHLFRKTQNWSGPTEWAEGADLARQALAGANGNPNTLRLAGHAVAYLGGDLDAGLAAVEQALTLNPYSSQVVSSAGWVFSYASKPEVAISLLERAIRLSPLDPQIPSMHGAIAMAHLVGRDPAKAVHWAERSLRQLPTWAAGHRILIVGLMQSGHVEEARRAAAIYQKRCPGPFDARMFRGFFRDKEWIEQYISSLRAAGISE